MSTSNSAAQSQGVAQSHPEYDAAVKVWQRCRDAFAGSDAVKARTTEYLPRVAPDMEEASYQSYLLRALFYGTLQRTVYGVAGTVLRNPETVSWNSPGQEKRYGVDLEDVDGTGATLARWLFASLRDEVLQTGRHIWVMDWSQALNRPLWCSYPAEAMPRWRTAKVNGVEMLTMVVLSEVEEVIPDASSGEPVFEAQIQRVLRVIWLDTTHATPVAMSEKWREKTVEVQTGEKTPPRTEIRWERDADSVVVLKRLGQTLDFLPVIVLGAMGVTPEVTDPPFRDLVDVNLSHYRSSADLEWGRHFTALPTPWVIGVPDGTTSLSIGSGKAWILAGQGAGAGMLEYTGQGLGALEKALADKESKMAALGARPFESSQSRGGVETAEALRLRQAADMTSLATLAMALSEAATRMLSWHCWWRGDSTVKLNGGLTTEGAIVVELSREFMDMQMSAEELRAWMELYQSEGISFETFYARLVSSKLAREGVEADEELALIRAGADALPAEPIDPLPPNPDEPVDEDGEGDEPAVDEDAPIPPMKKKGKRAAR